MIETTWRLLRLYSMCRSGDARDWTMLHCFSGSSIGWKILCALLLCLISQGPSLTDTRKCSLSSLASYYLSTNDKIVLVNVLLFILFSVPSAISIRPTFCFLIVCSTTVIFMQLARLMCSQVKLVWADMVLVLLFLLLKIIQQ